MLTVSEAEDSRINRISGVCPGSPDWYQLLNDGTRMLMRRGNWWGTLKVMRGCIYNGCVTWPRPVGTVLAFDRCGAAPPKNQWYDFNAVLPEHVRQFNRNEGVFGCARDIALVDHGTSPVFNQIPCGQNRYIRFMPVQPTDVGKSITLFGIDGNGVEIISTRSDGTIQPGLVLTLAIPFVQTPILIRRVDRVIKDETDGPIYGYQVSIDGTMDNLATYAPSETLPDYRTSRLVRSTCRDCGCWPSQIAAFVKLAFVPAKRPDDLILIDNLDALALAMQSIKMSDSFDSQGAEGMMARACHELNLDLRDRLPIDATPVRFKPYGTASLERVSIGMQ
jgi:hypothetical protein